MPIIEVKMTSGRTKEQKENIMRKITDVIEQELGCPRGIINVLIDDQYDLNEWSLGGETWENRLKGDSND